MTDDMGRQGELKIKIEPAAYGTWRWQVWRWNHRPTRWNRQRWIPTRSGNALTEWGAKRAADGAVKQIRDLESREPTVYYDPAR